MEVCQEVRDRFFKTTRFLLFFTWGCLLLLIVVGDIHQKVEKIASSNNKKNDY
jgi:hypothetical protein